MAAKRLKATATCELCDETFHPFPNSKGRFCSRKCYWRVAHGEKSPAYKNGKRTAACAVCGVTFDTYQKERRCCSRACRAVVQRGPGGSNWKGGRIVRGDGYVLVWIPPEERDWHQHSLKNGAYMYEHILVAERAMGRCLRKGEVVHHANFDSSDNRNTNLVVCDPVFHSYLHWEMARRWAREHLPARVA